MSTARLSPVRLHVAIRRVVRDAQGVYSLGGFKPDLAKQYAEKLARCLRRLRGVSEVVIAANLGPKHADAVRWAKSICGEWHRVNESNFSTERWELVRQLLPMPDRLQEVHRDELVAATVTTPPAGTQPSPAPEHPADVALTKAEARAVEAFAAAARELSEDMTDPPTIQAAFDYIVGCGDYGYDHDDFEAFRRALLRGRKKLAQAMAREPRSAVKIKHFYGR